MIELDAIEIFPDRNTWKVDKEQLNPVLNIKENRITFKLRRYFLLSIGRKAVINSVFNTDFVITKRQRIKNDLLIKLVKREFINKSENLVVKSTLDIYNFYDHKILYSSLNEVFYSIFKQKRIFVPNQIDKNELASCLVSKGFRLNFVHKPDYAICNLTQPSNSTLLINNL